MFPVGIMYYFGTNLDSRFSVPDFWPKESQTHKIPFEKDEIDAELKRLRERRLALRAQRLAAEGQGISPEHTEHEEEQERHPRPEILEATKLQGQNEPGKVARGWLGWSR